MACLGPEGRMLDPCVCVVSQSLGMIGLAGNLENGNLSMLY